MAGSLIVATRSARLLEGSVVGMIIAILSVRPFVARAGSLIVVTRLLGWSIVAIVGMFSAAFIVRPFVARAVLLVGVTRLLGWSIFAVVATPWFVLFFWSTVRWLVDVMGRVFGRGSCI